MNKAAKAVRQYVVFRHGSNSANQSMTPVMPVGIWEATDAKAAADMAADSVVVYSNQYLTARAASSVSNADYVAASEADYAREVQ